MKKLFLILLTILSILISAQKTFNLLPSGHIVVKAKIEGIEGNFILDTGAGINVFFSDFVEKIPKMANSYNFFTGFRATGERIDVLLYKSNQVSFSGKNFKNVPYSVANLKIPGIDGLISLKMFENDDLMINYDKKEISLVDSNTLSPNKSIDLFLSIQSDDTIDIFTNVTINDKYKVKAMLDSGAGKDSFWFSDKLIKKLSLDTAIMQISEKESEFNKAIKTKIYKGNIETISNNYSTIKNINVLFVENLIYEAKMSIDWIGNKLIISIKNRKIYIID